MKIDDEDKALRLIWSLPPFYEYVQTVLMYGKENVNFSEVTSKLISEERKLKNEENKSSESAALSVYEKWEEEQRLQKENYLLGMWAT